jgi:UDP-N-acetylglucosamine--N-acetylmuramyl-(pentapeptide) pyrophosphoryl-undecaprenol N-acetylglucosamine transferase
MAELLAHQVPALMIPFPRAADNHQLHNARIMADKIGGGVVVEESSLSSECLGVELKKILDGQGKKLQELRQGIKHFQETTPRHELFALVQQMIEETC